MSHAFFTAGETGAVWWAAAGELAHGLAYPFAAAFAFALTTRSRMNVALSDTRCNSSLLKFVPAREIGACIEEDAAANCPLWFGSATSLSQVDAYPIPNANDNPKP